MHYISITSKITWYQRSVYCMLCLKKRPTFDLL